MSKVKSEPLNKFSGFNFLYKQVSVKSDYCGYSDSIKCTIKDLSVNIEKVKEIANQFKKISRDYFGEILEGANTYIDVEWDWELIKTERDLKLSQAKEIYENRKNGNCVIIEEGIYELVYYPCDNEARLLKRPENYKDIESYCLDTIQRYTAHNEFAIAEAIVYSKIYLRNHKGEKGI